MGIIWLYLCTNTNFMLLQLYVNYQLKNCLLNTVYDSFPQNQLQHHLHQYINICSILITCSQQGKQKSNWIHCYDHDINTLKQYWLMNWNTSYPQLQHTFTNATALILNIMYLFNTKRKHEWFLNIYLTWKLQVAQTGGRLPGLSVLVQSIRIISMPPIWHRRQWTVLALVSIHNTCTSYTQHLSGTASASCNSHFLQKVLKWPATNIATLETKQGK